MIPDVLQAAALASALQLALGAETKRGSQQTAKRAIAILEAKGLGFRAPTAKERDALLAGFAMQQKVIYGAAFDIIQTSQDVDLVDPIDIAAKLDAITLFEIKSTNRAEIGPDFRQYFFNLSTAELLVAQSLGEQFRFAFVNTLTGDHSEMTLREVFAKARGIYPSWSTKF